MHKVNSIINCKPAMKKYYFLSYLMIFSICFATQAQNGLVLHYNFDQKSLTDRGSSKAVLKTYTSSPSFIKDVYGNDQGAIQLKALGSYLKTTGLKNMNKQEFSLAFWYCNLPSKDDRGLVVKATKPNDEYSLFSLDQRKHKSSDSLKMMFYVYEKDTRKSNLESRRPIWQQVNLDKKWHHIALTCKAGGKVKIYIDGEFRTEKPIGQSELGMTATQFQIGHNDDSYDNRMGGFDDMMLFNRELSADEIRHIKAGVFGEGGEAGLAEMHNIPEEDMGEGRPATNEDFERKESVAYDPNANPAGGVTFSYTPSRKSFTSKQGNQIYSYTMPDNLEYKGHLGVTGRLAIHFYDKKVKNSYIGLWDKQLNYKCQYNLAALKVNQFVLQETKYEGLVMVYYTDPKHKTHFAGIFDANMKYLGQYQLNAKSSDVRVVFENKFPVVYCTYEGKKWKVILNRDGTVLKTEDPTVTKSSAAKKRKF